MAAENLKKVKILVLGNTGVGKTSLVHLMCHQEVLSNPSWTVGCSVNVKLHEFGHTPSSSYFLEFWDVGGAPAHKKGRQVFYQNTNGLILVHDLTNRKSHSHLSKWLTEFHHHNKPGGAKTTTTSSLGSLSDSMRLDSLEYDPERFADQELPILIVGTKMDQVNSSVQVKTPSSVSPSRMSGAASISVDCTNTRQFSLDSQQMLELNKFFDKVIERRFFPSAHHHHHHMTGMGSSERSRPSLARRTSSNN